MLKSIYHFLNIYIYAINGMKIRDSNYIGVLSKIFLHTKNGLPQSGYKTKTGLLDKGNANKTIKRH